jgi:SAM-dependent methyltransferase
MDVRVAPRGSVPEITGREDWNPNWSCEPDVLGDFRAMPFADASFQMVVFDPPHNIRAKPEGITGLKYGALPKDTEQDDLRRGLLECWRVLAPGGTMVFKWAGPLKRVLSHFPTAPIVGTRSVRGDGTQWFVFYKPQTSA